jgi:hypothetical protein
MQIRGRVDAQLNVEAEHQRHRYDLQERRGPPLDPAEIQQPSHQSKLSLSLSPPGPAHRPTAAGRHPVAAGGAARERILAMLDDCEYRRLRAEEEGNDIRALPDPVELRRRLGLPEQRRR